VVTAAKVLLGGMDVIFSHMAALQAGTSFILKPAPTHLPLVSTLLFVINYFVYPAPDIHVPFCKVSDEITYQTNNVII